MRIAAHHPKSPGHDVQGQGSIRFRFFLQLKARGAGSDARKEAGAASRR